MTTKLTGRLYIHTSREEEYFYVHNHICKSRSFGTGCMLHVHGSSAAHQMCLYQRKMQCAPHAAYAVCPPHAAPPPTATLTDPTWCEEQAPLHPAADPEQGRTAAASGVCWVCLSVNDGCSTINQWNVTSCSYSLMSAVCAHAEFTHSKS